jgi:hypothetical protein
MEYAGAFWGSWALAPLAAAACLARTALRLTHHAYLILTPLGIEILQFFRPAAGMQRVMWNELRDSETDSALTRLTLHRNPEKTSGIHLSPKPIRGGLFLARVAPTPVGRAAAGAGHHLALAEVLVGMQAKPADEPAPQRAGLRPRVQCA